MVIADAQVHIWSSGTPSPPHRQIPSFSKDELTAADKELIMGRAICAWLDWKLPA